MLEKVIKKLEDEMKSTKNNPYIQVVGDFLIQYVTENPESADKIIKDGKTIIKSLDAMKIAAENKKVGNCAVLTDQEGFEIVLRYFEIEPGIIKKYENNQKSIQKVEVLKIKDITNFDVKIDDFI